MAAANLTKAQAKTLATVSANGGEMNGYAGQPGFYTLSVAPLVRLGYLEPVATCDNCQENPAGTDYTGSCDRPLTGQSGGERCYHRVRITNSGRSANEVA